MTHIRYYLAFPLYAIATVLMAGSVGLAVVAGGIAGGNGPFNEPFDN